MQQSPNKAYFSSNILQASTNSFISDFIQDCDPCARYSTTLFAPNGEKKNILIYPNPGNKTIKIIGMDVKNITTMSIYNEIGQIKYEITKFNNEIDVSKLSPGIYFVSVIYNSGANENAKFMVE